MQDMEQPKVIPYVTMQAQKSSTFNIPPSFLAGGCTLPEMWDHHFRYSPTHPLFLFDNDGCIEEISWKQAVQALYRAAKNVKTGLMSSMPPTQLDKPPVVGIVSFQGPSLIPLPLFAHALKLVRLDTPSTWAHITAVIYIGATAFVISPQNTPETLASLLQKAECHSLLVFDKPSSQDLIRRAVALLPHDYHVKFIDMSDYKQLFLRNDDLELADSELGRRLFDGSMSSPVLILHTSGTTSTPQLVIHSHRSLVQWGQTPYYGDKDLCGYTCGSASSHLYHVMGITTHVVFPTCSGQKSVVFNPFNPEAPPTAEQVLHKAIACHANYIYCVPAFIEEWANDDDQVNLLRNFDVISYGGGRLDTTLGNKLASRGVRLCSMWGCSEVGAATRWFFDGPIEDWEYIRLTRQTEIHWEPVEGTELFEAVVLESPHKFLPETNTWIDGRKGFATKDLFEKHPTKPGLWRNRRRGDDVLIHSTGKKLYLIKNVKTHPGPMESIIAQHPLIRHAIVFGHSRRNTGLLVERRETNTPADHTELIEAIWPVVELANRSVPHYSRILKEMIIVANPVKPFALSPKQTLRRGTILTDYANQIDSAYRAMEESACQKNSAIAPPTWDLPHIQAFVRALVQKVLVLRDEPGDYDDLFRIGADRQAMKTSGFDTALLGTNFVYSHPCVEKLALHIRRIVSGGNADAEGGLRHHPTTLQSLVLEHSVEFPRHIPTIRTMPKGSTVLITGTTGGLGTHLLARLIQQSSVERIYALNRPSHGVQAVRRQEIACDAQGFPPSVAHSAKVIYLEGDISQHGLGLDPTTQNDVLDSLNTIFHLAWPVNFNLNVASFAPSIEGVYRLVEFSLRSPLPTPPDLIFASSMSVMSGWRKDDRIPEVIFPYPDHAIGNGYSESKWVAENIMLAARKATPIRAVSVRFGQLLGSARNGNWTTQEWFPSIVCAAQMTNSFPNTEGSVSWLPMEAAASVLDDVRNRSSDIDCLHVVHPKPVTWTSLASPIAQALKIPLVPFNTWLKALGTLNEDRPSSATLLLGYFSSLSDADRKSTTVPTVGEVFSGNVYGMDNALLICGHLGDLKPLRSEDFDCYLKHWRQLGFLD
ncbi:hypothetical protein V5O48_010852 [Marasmius crinis-equi]|uniref:Acetyl-CoA synthetase-like protein n=1 Tax=Marasmius crinis-equi TaxID=585013 RepID=A0ABR3F773_9AGAR